MYAVLPEGVNVCVCDLESNRNRIIENTKAPNLFLHVVQILVRSREIYVCMYVLKYVLVVDTCTCKCVHALLRIWQKCINPLIHIKAEIMYL